MADEFGYDSKGNYRNTTMSKRAAEHYREQIEEIKKQAEEERKKEEDFIEQQLNDNRGKMVK